MLFLRKNKALKLETELIEREIHRGKRFKYIFSILIFEVTDSTSRGLSKLLPGKTISFHILQKNLRPYDKIIQSPVRRYYIILPQTSKNDTDKVEKRILKLAEVHHWGKVNFALVSYPEDGGNAKKLLAEAINLLKKNKLKKYKEDISTELVSI